MTKSTWTLPPCSGTPYEAGTVSAALQRDRNGRPVITATFGNTFSERVEPMTRRAALELRDQLDAALAEASDYPELQRFAIATPGPLMRHEAADLDAAIEYAKRYMPMKRGWTYDVTTNDSGTAATLRARNSRGRVVNAFRVFQPAD